MNISNIALTNDEIDLLKLGLNYTPTPKHNLQELQSDIFDFTRKVRLAYHFRNSNYNATNLL